MYQAHTNRQTHKQHYLTAQQDHHLNDVRLNLCMLRLIETITKRQIDRFSRFCTAYGRKSLCYSMGALIIHGTLAPRGEYELIDRGRQPSRKGHNPLFGPCLLWPNGRPSLAEHLYKRSPKKRGIACVARTA